MKSLSDEDRAQLVGRYLARFEKHGIDAQALNAGDPEKYARQHAMHFAVGSMEGATVLDVGCGLANFYEFIKQRCVNVRYIGYDVVEPFVVANRERFTEATFRVVDISRDPIIDRCDYVIMCQVFNNRYKDADNKEIIKSAVSKAFAATKKAVSVDMLSSYVGYMDRDLFYYSPEDMFSFAKTLTPYVSLLHGYLDHHFTLQLFKDPIRP